MGEEGGYNSKYDGLTDVPSEQRLEGRQGGTRERGFQAVVSPPKVPRQVLV